MRALWPVLALGITILPLSTARADGPPKVAAADARGGGNDEVSLKNGGMLRGTIVALEPQKQVVILIQGTGEQRTIPWAEVNKVERGKYASSSSDATPEPKPKKVRPHRDSDDDEDADDEDADKPKKRRHARRDDEDEGPGKSTVTLTSDQPGVSFHYLTGEMNGIVTAGNYWGGIHAESYRDLCTAPCSMRLENGSYRFGLSLDGNNPVKTDEPVLINGPRTITGEYDSNRGVRIGGIVVMTVGAIGGLALALASIKAGPCEVVDPSFPEAGCVHKPSFAMMGAGMALVGVGSIVGLIMMLQRDHAHISVSAGPSASVLTRGHAREAWSADQLKGLTVKAVF